MMTSPQNKLNSIVRRSLGHLLAAVLLLLALSTPSAAADSDLHEMPKPEAVQHAIIGRDPLDTAARRDGAFYILREMIKDLAGPRLVRNQLTSAELKLLTSYGQAESELGREGRALLQKAGAPSSGPESPSPKWFRLSEHYHYDAALKQQLLTTFFSPRFQASYAAALAASAANRAPVTPTAVPDVTARATSLWDDLASTALGVTLALAGLLAVLSYPALAVLRSMRVRHWAVTGPITSAKVWSETHVSGGGVYHNAAGHYVPGSVYSSTARKDEFFIQEGNRQHAVTLTNTSVAVAPGHRVTAVWVGSKPKAKSWWLCRIHNHETGQSQELRVGVKRARGGSGRTAFLWTLLVTLGLFLLLEVTGAAAGRGSDGALAVAGSAFVGNWITGAILMKIVHVFGDRRILKRARAFENPGIV